MSFTQQKPPSTRIFSSGTFRNSHGCKILYSNALHSRMLLFLFLVASQCLGIALNLFLEDVNLKMQKRKPKVWAKQTPITQNELRLLKILGWSHLVIRVFSGKMGRNVSSKRIGGGRFLVSCSETIPYCSTWCDVIRGNKIDIFRSLRITAFSKEKSTQPINNI